jgi:hypothetical protein
MRSHPTLLPGRANTGKALFGSFNLKAINSTVIELNKSISGKSGLQMDVSQYYCSSDTVITASFIKRSDIGMLTTNLLPIC